MRGRTIGKLAEDSGVHLETIRYYERIGIMPEPERTTGGHRSYAEKHVKRLGFIRRARELGFSLEDIRALLDLAAPGRRSCAEVQAIAAAHLAEVRAKINDLSRLQATLSETVSRCGTETSPSCPVIEALSGAEPGLRS